MIIDDSIWASGLGSVLTVNPEVDTVIAGVTYTNISNVDLGPMMPITIANTTDSEDEILQIGDPDGVIKRLFSISTMDTGWDTGDYSPIQLASFFRKGAVIRQMNFDTSDAVQFTKAFNYYAVDVDGSSASKDIRGSLVTSRRATDSDGLVRTLDFGYDSGVLLNHENAIYLTQLANTTLTLNIQLQSIIR
jgi:hypothetical protein